MGSFLWMLQWPIRAVLLLPRLPLGVECDGFGYAFLAAVLFGLTAWLMEGFWLRHGLSSAVVDSLLSAVALRWWACRCRSRGPEAVAERMGACP